MILIITTNVSSAVNWWLRPTGCELSEPTREQLLDWHTEKPRKITEAANPLVITGLAEIGAAIGLEFLSSNKNVRLLSVLLGLKGLIFNIVGGSHAYDLISEAKSKRLADSTNTNATKKSIGPVHNPEERDTTEEPVTVKIHSDKSLSGNAIGEIIENGEISEDTDDRTPIKQSLRELLLLEEKFDTEKILNAVRKVLNKCRQNQYKNIAKEAYEEIFEIGRKAQVKVLAKAFEKSDIRLKRWAMLCLISKESPSEVKEAEQVLINALKNPEDMAIMLSILSNENLQELTPKITELLRKSAA